MGFWVDKYPEHVKEIYNRGHDVGNHSTNHPYMTKLSDDEIEKELNITGDKIEKLIKEKPILFRPPFGDYNDRVINVCKDNGYYVIQWDVDSLDWKEMGVQPVVDRVTRNVRNGSIVLFHNNAKYVLEYLPIIIERLQREGYEIVPISQLIYKENFYMDNTGRQIKKGIINNYSISQLIMNLTGLFLGGNLHYNLIKCYQNEFLNIIIIIGIGE